MSWSAALLLALTATVARSASAQIAQNHVAADEVFDELIHRMAACKMSGGDQVPRIACLLEQVHCERHLF